MIVGFTPGGSIDLVGRLIGGKLAGRIGQQVVIDNRPGASGIIAAEIVAKTVAVDNILVLAPHVRRGALNALAVTTAKRTPILSDVPSLAESGLPGFDTSGWFSMYCAPGTPADPSTQLAREIPAWRKAIQDAGLKVE